MPTHLAPPLSWVKPEVDHALNKVRESIAGHLDQSGAPDALRQCPSQIHQVTGALNILGLKGVVGFCESIEQALISVSTKSASPKSAIATLDRAVLALKEFIDGLARGETNAPIKLLPVYREVATLQGAGNVTEKDLFYPDLSIIAPEHPSARILPVEKLPAIVLAQRSQFQHGFLAMMRNPADHAGPKTMRRALETLDMISTQLPPPRSLWWSATALVDGLILADKPHEWFAGAKSLCSKLDLRMRDVARMQTPDYPSDTLMRDVLFAVAKCPFNSTRIREVRHLYQLDTLFPEPSLPGLMEFDMDWLGPALEDMRSRLRAAKECWVRYVSGDTHALKTLRETVAGLKQKNGELGNAPLGRMLDTISVAAARLPNPYPRQGEFMVTEMASAFLLIENIIEQFVETPPDLAHQVDIMGAWLLDAASGKSSENLPSGLSENLSQEVSRTKLRTVVAKELRENLQHIEQVVDTYTRKRAGVNTLMDLPPLLKQVQGALDILGYDRAAQVQSMCNKLLASHAASSTAWVPEELDTLIEGLSSIGFFLDPCIHGLPPADGALDIFFERLRRRQAAQPEAKAGVAPPAAGVAPVAPAQTPAETPAKTGNTGAAADAPPPLAAQTAIAPPETVQPAPAHPVDADHEMLDVFREEAGSVLAQIQQAAAACVASPGNHEALVVIRRGFHTLKGSGRMVGLNDIGETAWEVEQVMNRWLDQQWPADSLLLEMIGEARQVFADWLASLNAGNGREINTAALLQKIGALKTAQGPAPDIPDTPLPAAEPEADIVIGPLRLSRNLYDLYCHEAPQHVAAICGTVNSRDWTRSAANFGPLEIAAHTLASISRTTGFDAPAGIAGRIEHCMQYAARIRDSDDLQLLQESATALECMITAIQRQEFPAPADTLAEALDQLVIRLRVPAIAATAGTPIAGQAADPATTEPVIEPLDDASLVRAAAAQTADDKRLIRDDIDAALLPIFLEEAGELLPLIGRELRDWTTSPDSKQAVLSLQRALHTLKGSARMAGAMRLGELTHLTETLVDEASGLASPSAESLESIAQHVDRITQAVDVLRRGGVNDASAPAADTAVETQAGRDPIAPDGAEQPQRGNLQLRIHADTVDRLLNEASEIGIAGSRIDSEAAGVKQAMGDLDESLSRLKIQLREMEVQADSQMQSRHSVLDAGRQDYDPLELDRYTRLQELTRLMAESVHDIATVRQSVTRHLGEMRAAGTRQARINRELQQILMRARTVPFSTLDERLYQVARRTSREIGKKAHLEISGGHLEVDRGVLERITAPLEHLLRNAIAHGVESVNERMALGKPEAGQIAVAVRQEGNEISITVTDDGAGIDTGRLHARALDLGLLGAGDKPTQAELLALIYHPGMSTSAAVTEVSGRGIGMEVVRSEIDAVGGHVDVDSTQGTGTTFRIFLPLTVAVTQAVVVRCGKSFFAMPSSSVEQVLRLKPEELVAARQQGRIEHRTSVYPLHEMSTLLDIPMTGADGYHSVLLLHSGLHRIALHVEELVENREIVVKHINAQLARAPGVTGATVLASGQVALIINPVQLSRRQAFDGRGAIGHVTEIPVFSGRRTVMVVDDSLTVRKITGRLLERENYRVLTAKDGLDALEQLQETQPDVLLVDIEMPRMDGFELAKRVRADSQLAAIPIIMISSRTAEKHREHARSLGVNAFLGKPYQDQELLDQMKLLLKIDLTN